MIRKFFQIIEDWIDKDLNSLYGLAKVIFAVSIACVLGMGVIIGVLSLFDSPTHYITLDERDWHCTTTQTLMVPVLVGKVLIPEPRTVCTTWEKNQ